MVTAIEILERLERRLILSIPSSEIKVEVEKRLKVQARMTKANGFRKGKVPMKMVAEKYAHQLENEVLGSKLNSAFNMIIKENNLHIVGNPKIEPKNHEDDTSRETLDFNATFEVYPEVKISDLSVVEVNAIRTEVGDAEIDKTIDILRKQRAHYHVKGGDENNTCKDGSDSNVSAEKGDRVTIDFSGTIDGKHFQDSKASNYVYIIGEGYMLPDFEKSILGLKTGEQRRFDLNFPNDYHGKDVAGRTAKFDITLKKLEVVNLPEVDIEFSKSLGIKDGDLCKMRAEIKINLEREVDSHVARRNKETVLSMLLEVSSLEVPNTLCEREIERLTEITRQEMTRRGMEVDENLLTPDMLRPKADRRVRLGLILAKIASENELNATEGQIRSKVESLSEGYENPEEIVKSYFKSQHRLADVESLVVEENVINYVLNKSKVVEKLVPFDELMNRVRV